MIENQVKELDVVKGIKTRSVKPVRVLKPLAEINPIEIKQEQSPMGRHDSTSDERPILAPYGSMANLTAPASRRGFELPKLPKSISQEELSFAPVSSS